MSTTVPNPILGGAQPPSSTPAASNHESGKTSVKRAETFSRADTFSPNQRNTDFGGSSRNKSRATFDADGPRPSAFTFDGLARTFTDIGQVFDPDGEFTKNVIQDYVKHADEAQAGELPLPTGFARKYRFWKIIFLGGCISVIIAGFGAVFINMIDNVPKKWATCDYDNDSTCGDYYTGEKWWMIVTGGAGLAVGLVRFATNFPRNPTGLFQEIEEMHVDPYWAIPTYIISMISLCGGATLGPEQALGNAGGGFATWVSEKVGDWWFDSKEYRQLFVLGGMASALGALFGTPMLGACMLHELGDPPMTYMESISYLSIVSIIGFAMYYSLVTNTYVDHISSSTIDLSLYWLHDGGYYNWMVVTSAIFGVISAAICFLCLITIGISRQLFNRIRQRFEKVPFLAEVLPPLIGGIVIGAVNWALPATVGNGKLVFGFLIKQGINGNFTKTQLLRTGFARIFLFGVSSQCGFIGGIIFPLLTIGCIAGVLAYQYFDYLDPYFCIACFMCAVPMGVVPMLITFPLLIIFIFFFSFYQAVPVFVAGLTSYCCLSGSGLIKKMSLISAEKERREAAAKARNKAVADSDRDTSASTAAADRAEEARKQADEFTMDAYRPKAKGASASSEVDDSKL